MDEPISSLIDELQRLATEDAPSQVGQETRLAEAPSEAQPVKPPPSMPLPRNVRGRRY